jgi:methylaspartate mutase epsilon subunit
MTGLAPDTDATARAVLAALPDSQDVIAYLRALRKPAVADVLDRARAGGRVAIQPRCGVGNHAEMRALLLRLEAEARPDVLTLTIASPRPPGRCTDPPET